MGSAMNGMTIGQLAESCDVSRDTLRPSRTTPEKIASSVSKTGFTASVKPKADESAVRR
jgi:hypothetical protein